MPDVGAVRAGLAKPKVPAPAKKPDKEPPKVRDGMIRGTAPATPPAPVNNLYDIRNIFRNAPTTVWGPGQAPGTPLSQGPAYAMSMANQQVANKINQTNPYYKGYDQYVSGSATAIRNQRKLDNMNWASYGELNGQFGAFGESGDVFVPLYKAPSPYLPQPAGDGGGGYFGGGGGGGGGGSARASALDAGLINWRI